MSKIRALDWEDVRVQAVASAWASLDGKLKKFEASRNKPVDKQPGGHYYGYLADAEELIRRIERRGFYIARKRA